MKYRDSVPWVWVLARYPSNSEMGKHVKAMAEAGIGYHIIRNSISRNDPIIVGLKYPRARIEPIPPHLTVADKAQQAALDKLESRRN